MSSTHLRQQAGGNPSQGPEGDMANPTPGPGVGGDFPDAPEEDVADRPQDQPDLDKFAARFGLIEGEGGASGESEPHEETNSVRSLLTRIKPKLTSVASTVSSKMSAGFDAASDKLADLTDGDATDEPDLAALIERVDGIRTVMVTTGDERGTLSARPLTVQRIDASGDVYFIVDENADWVTPIVDAANVSFVRRDRDWISVAGRATVVDDPTLLDELWNAATDAFFPGGKDDGATVLQVHADRWEYWSAPNQVAQFVEIARSAVTDGEPDLGGSGTVET